VEFTREDKSIPEGLSTRFATILNCYEFPQAGAFCDLRQKKDAPLGGYARRAKSEGRNKMACFRRLTENSGQ
jgi:hypothetical protein